MRNVLEFTEADWERPKTLAEEMADLVREMFDGAKPVPTKDVADRLGRN